MKSCFSISSDDGTYMFSLIKWSIVRKIMSKLFKANPYQFTPSYELAIYERISGRINFKNPLSIFHFASKDIAVARTEYAKKLFEEGDAGMHKLIIDAENFDHHQEALYWDPSDHAAYNLAPTRAHKRRVLNEHEREIASIQSVYRTMSKKNPNDNIQQ